MNDLIFVPTSNKLEVELGLATPSDVDIFYNDPCEWTFRNIPKRVQTLDMVRYAISKDGRSIRDVSKKLLSQDLCLEAVQQNYKALFYIPEKYITKELLEAAVNANGLALEYIPTKRISRNLCKQAVQQNGMALPYVPKKYITKEILEIAVRSQGLSLEYAPQKFLSYDLCKEAVQQNGLALSYTPIEYFTKELMGIAVRNNGLSLKYIPKNMINAALVSDAVKSLCEGYYVGDFIDYVPSRLQSKKLCKFIVEKSPCSLRYIKLSHITRELCVLAMSLDRRAIQYVPEQFMDERMVIDALGEDALLLRYVPLTFLTKEMCQSAFDTNSKFLQFIPEKYITCEMCKKLIDETDEELKSLLAYYIPDSLHNNNKVLDALVDKYGVDEVLSWNDTLNSDTFASNDSYTYTKKLSSKSISYLRKKPRPEDSLMKVQAIEVPLSPVIETEDRIGGKESFGLQAMENNENDTNSQSIFYISDIHIEQQLKELSPDGVFSYQECWDFIERKVNEMVSSAKSRNGILLIAGDVACSSYLDYWFYHFLSEKWEGLIVGVLGNHELWQYPRSNKITESLDEIVNYYERVINHRNIFGSYCALLQNAMLVKFKNKKVCVIKENQILSSSDEDLAELCSKSSLIILGGLGFSGLNSHYNATLGLYRSTITTLEEDVRLTKQFYNLYLKVERCAGDKQVIVLTHTPLNDWCEKPSNPNWVYINGHTHQNTLERRKDGTTILCDNQVGYTPKKWTLKEFSIPGWYDPFAKMNDGIYEITSEMYADFNVGRGIQCNGCKYSGSIYALKRKGIYMFVLKTESSLCILSGGQRKRLNHDMQYYYDNMVLYNEKVMDAIRPYYHALVKISDEVKSFGGEGRIHGCIVDIDYYNHIYINPFDGKITPYYAEDVMSRFPYPDVKSLLKVELPSLLPMYLNACKKGALPTLNSTKIVDENISEKKGIATVPECVIGTEMYSPSRIMKSFQYVIENKVIRIWNDDILTSHSAPKISKSVQLLET